MPVSVAVGSRRDRVWVAVFGVLGAVLTAWSLRLPPGDPWFLPGTVAVSACWLLGALTVRPRILRRGDRALPDTLLGLGVGVVLAVVFLIGAGIVAQIPLLREPTERLLEHGAGGALGPVLVVTVIGGIFEEYYFRGALYRVLGRHMPILLSTLAYTIVVALSGIALLGLAGLLLGLLTAYLRHRTGGLLASVITHLVWSLTMLLLLRPTLDLWNSL